MQVKNTTLLTLVSKILDAIEANDKPEEERLRKIALEEIYNRHVPEQLREYGGMNYAHRHLEQTLHLFTVKK